MAEHFEERVSNDPLLLRIGGWGTAAAVALGVFAYAAQSDAGSKRLQLALDGTLDEPTYTVAVAAPAQPDPAVKVLQAKLERFDTERGQIDARLTTLEHGLQDVTGSIRRETQAPRPAQRPAVQPFIEPPVIPRVETLPGAPAVKVTSVAPQAETAPAPAAQPESVAEPVLADIPIPRPRPVRHHPTHAEYGIELGTASDIDALHVRWVAVKANFGPLLVGMSPVGVRDRQPGSTKLRLIAGPLKNLTAARELCARFVAMNGYCWPTRVDATDVVMR